MSDEFRGRCNGATCGTEVLMRKRGERWHPYEWPVEACAVCNGKGAIDVTKPPTLFEPAGSVEREICGKCKGSGKRYRSHFETCPDADAFRANKRGGVQASGDED